MSNLLTQVVFAIFGAIFMFWFVIMLAGLTIVLVAAARDRS